MTFKVGDRVKVYDTPGNSKEGVILDRSLTGDVFFVYFSREKETVMKWFGIEQIEKIEDEEMKEVKLEARKKYFDGRKVMTYLCDRRNLCDKFDQFFSPHLFIDSDGSSYGFDDKEILKFKEYKEKIKNEGDFWVCYDETNGAVNSIAVDKLTGLFTSGRIFDSKKEAIEDCNNLRRYFPSYKIKKFRYVVEEVEDE